MKLLLCILLLSLCSALYGQDLIILKKGDTIRCSISERGRDLVLYTLPPSDKLQALPYASIASITSEQAIQSATTLQSFKDSMLTLADQRLVSSGRVDLKVDQLQAEYYRYMRTQYRATNVAILAGAMLGMFTVLNIQDDFKNNSVIRPGIYISAGALSISSIVMYSNLYKASRKPLY